MRVNARLDKDMAEKLRRLLLITQLSTTDILKRALDVYFRQVTATARAPKAAELLKRCGLVGCGGGDAQLSHTYKARLTRSLGRKV